MTWLESPNRHLNCVTSIRMKFFGNATVYVYSNAVWVARTQIGRVSSLAKTRSSMKNWGNGVEEATTFRRGLFSAERS